jgi:hypothetical protein
MERKRFKNGNHMFDSVPFIPLFRYNEPFLL